MRPGRKQASHHPLPGGLFSLADDESPGLYGFPMSSSILPRGLSSQPVSTHDTPAPGRSFVCSSFHRRSLWTTKWAPLLCLEMPRLEATSYFEGHRGIPPKARLAPLGRDSIPALCLQSLLYPKPFSPQVLEIWGSNLTSADHKLCDLGQISTNLSEPSLFQKKGNRAC